MVVEWFVRVTPGKGFLTENLPGCLSAAPRIPYVCSPLADPVISLNTCPGVAVCLELCLSHS